jgi:hypothetical protein
MDRCLEYQIIFKNIPIFLNSFMSAGKLYKPVVLYKNFMEFGITEFFRDHNQLLVKMQDQSLLWRMIVACLEQVQRLKMAGESYIYFKNDVYWKFVLISCFWYIFYNILTKVSLKAGKSVLRILSYG